MTEEFKVESEQDLYMAVGEIRADVRQLVADRARLAALEKTVERRSYLGAGFIVLILSMSDPKQWSSWFSVAKGILF